MNRVDEWIDKCEDAESMLLRLKDWVQYWDVEEDLADQIYDHLRLASYKMRIARANIEADEAHTQGRRDI